MTEDEEGRFLTSHRSEEGLGKGYGRDALVPGLVAAGPFVVRPVSPWTGA